MTDVWDIVRPKVEAALKEGAGANIPSDVVGRALLVCAVEIFKLTRSDEDIASELQFTADTLDQNEPQAFMRP